MALVRLREICTPSGIVIDVRCEEVGPQDDDVQSYPVECRTIPSHNFARVVQAELEARGAVIDSSSFDSAVSALDRVVVEATGLPLDSHIRLDPRSANKLAAYWRERYGVVPPLPNWRCALSPQPEHVIGEVPTTYCFDCGQMAPVADTWTKKSDPNYALCEGCFRLAESAGRAKEGQR